MRELLGEKIPVTEIAARIGVEPSSVYRRIRRLGITEPRMQPALTPERLALFGRLLDEGWPYKEIVRTHRTSMETLRKHFPGRGWDHAMCGTHSHLYRNEKRIYRQAGVL